MLCFPFHFVLILDPLKRDLEIDGGLFGETVVVFESADVVDLLAAPSDRVTAFHEDFAGTGLLVQTGRFLHFSSIQSFLPL